MLKLGSHTLQVPVVLAPMAGVTNAPFRSLCRQFGPGLVYVNEMVMATTNYYTIRPSMVRCPHKYCNLLIPIEHLYDTKAVTIEAINTKQAYAHI
jgi:tRNA-dihydrouridine synthase